MKTKVRVKRAELIRVVEARMKQEQRRHVREVETYPQRHEEWKAACVTKLEKALASARKGRLIRDRYHDALAYPAEPAKPPAESRALCNLKRIHATLAIGSEDSILLSQEDASDYFGPCNV